MPEEEVKSYIEKMEACGGKVERYSLFPGAMCLSLPPPLSPHPSEL